MEKRKRLFEITFLIILTIYNTFGEAHHMDIMSNIVQYTKSVKERKIECRSSRTIPETVTIEAPTMGIDVEGFKMKTINDRDIYAFQGIRYAEMPVRFQPPDKLETDYYTNDGATVYVANHLPKRCSQFGVMNQNLSVGTEDCLFLNVYTPQAQKSDGTYDNLLTVMLFVHGGAFITGDTSLYMPTRFLDKDVVLVTIQYRLGLFGFFSTATSEAKGNAALYDQQIAMQWVREYIEDFGGDPNQVIIFGESAGAHSVTHHLLSQYSKDLFKGVIAESGSALSFGATDPDPVTSAQLTAEALDCDVDLNDMDAILDCAMNAEEEELIHALAKLLATPEFNGARPIVQDFLEPEEDPIVPSPPEEAFTNGGLQGNVSLIIGTNRDEGSFDFGGVYTYFLNPTGLVDNGLFLQEEIITYYLKTRGIEDKTHSLTESLADLYLGEADRTNFTQITPGMVDLCGMFSFKSSGYEYAKMHSLYKEDSTKTYFYSFDFESDDTNYYWFFGGDTPPIPHGITHSDEMLYLFSLPSDQDSTERLVNERMVELWTNFAKYQDPTPEESTEWDSLDIEKWEEMDVQNQRYMLMEEDFHVEDHFTQRWTISTQGESTTRRKWSSRSRSRSKPRSSSNSIETDWKNSNSGACVDDYLELQENYNELYKTTYIYMGVMIAFVIMFFFALCESLFLFYRVYMKNR